MQTLKSTLLDLSLEVFKADYNQVPLLCNLSLTSMTKPNDDRDYKAIITDSTTNHYIALGLVASNGKLAVIGNSRTLAKLAGPYINQTGELYNEVNKLAKPVGHIDKAPEPKLPNPISYTYERKRIAKSVSIDFTVNELEVLQVLANEAEESALKEVITAMCLKALDNNVSDEEVKNFVTKFQ